MRVYADSSVFGGVYDDEFKWASRLFFDNVKSRKFDLVVSALVEDELAWAPPVGQKFFEGLTPFFSRVEVTARALELRRAYVRAGIVSRKSAADALHVALATIGSCRVLVSWNFHHIVHFQKIPKYNAVNRLLGFSEIAIHTPLEVSDVDK